MLIDPRFAKMRGTKSDLIVVLPPIDRPGTQMDPVARRLTVAGVEVHLPPTPFLVIHALASRPGKPQTRAWVSRSVDPSERRVIDVDHHIRTAREAIRKAAPQLRGQRDPIRSVHGVGYQWTDPPAPATTLPLPVAGERSPQPVQARLGVEGLSMMEEQCVLYARRGLREMHIAVDLCHPIPAVRAALQKARALGIKTTPEDP